MEEFLDKKCYLSIEIDGRNFYYLCALITSISETHISFNDLTNNNSPHTYRKSDVVEIKLSNKNSNGN